MAKFTLTLRVDTHDHSSRAHRHFIGEMLAQVAQRVGSTEETEGDIITPAVGAQPQRVIGSWQIED